MNRYLVILLVLISSSAAAAEAVIVETEGGITVEYSGAAQQKDPAAPGAAVAAAPTLPSSPGLQARARSLSAQLQQVNREIAALSVQTGSETDEQLAAKQAQILDKQSKATQLAQQFRDATGMEPPAPAEAPVASPDAGSPQSAYLKQRNDREERIRNTKGMRRGTGTETGS